MQSKEKDKALAPYLMQPVEVTGVIRRIKPCGENSLSVCLGNPVIKTAGARIAIDHVWVMLWSFINPDKGLVRVGRFVSVVGYVSAYRRWDGLRGHDVKVKSIRFAP